jgi:hypothetical protein
MQTFFLKFAVILFVLISNSFAGSGLKVLVAVEVSSTLAASEQLPNGGLLMQVKRVWSWVKGDGSAPIPSQDQLVIVTDFAKQSAAASGDVYLLEIEHTGLAKTETGDQVRVFKTLEERDPKSLLTPRSSLP